jgi:hypothetical protein
MTFPLWFIFFLFLIILYYITYKLGRIAGIGEAFEIADKTMDIEIAKRWKKLKEDKRIEEEEELRKFHMGFAYKPKEKE